MGYHKNKKVYSSSSSSSKPEQLEYKYVLKQSVQEHTLPLYERIVKLEGIPVDSLHLRYKLDKHHWEKIWQHVLEKVLADAFQCDGKPVEVKIGALDLARGSSSNKESSLRGYYYLNSWEVSFHCNSNNISINPQWNNTLLKQFFVPTITNIQGIPVPKSHEPAFNWDGTIAISEVLPDGKFTSLDDKYPRTKLKASIWAAHYLYFLMNFPPY